MAELAPPETLTPPEPIKVIEQDQADEMVKLDQDKIPELDAKVDEFISQIMAADVHTPVFEQKVKSIHTMGNAEIRASANVSNRMLERPANSIDSSLFDDKSPISKSLVDLRNTVEDLDPSRQADMFRPRKLLGLIPMGNRVRNYFLRYQSSQKQINAILESLYRGQDELRKDNAAIEQEKVNLWALMQSLRQYIYVGKKVDAAIEARIAEIELQDPEKARIVREEMLFYVRQKVTDLLTQLAVSVQGYLALDMVRKNNLELIKGVDRATTTTISALRTAVIVAQALTNQRLVLDQITALNRTTSSLIESTSVLLKTQSGKIYEQATSATVDVEQLRNAFKNIYDSMDMISSYKAQALTNMKQTVNVLSQEVDHAQTYLDRVRQEEVASATEDLNLNANPPKLGEVNL
jgi:uncharacterized protein YaaN involved in tellurite resistance